MWPVACGLFSIRKTMSAASRESAEINVEQNSCSTCELNHDLHLHLHLHLLQHTAFDKGFKPF
jgi:hypothetical protein